MSKQFAVPIILPADPTAALEAVTKQYCDANAGGGPAGSEVYIGADDPIGTAPETELWLDTDDPTGIVPVVASYSILALAADVTLTTTQQAVSLSTALPAVPAGKTGIAIISGSITVQNTNTSATSSVGGRAVINATGTAEHYGTVPAISGVATWVTIPIHAYASWTTATSVYFQCRATSPHNGVFTCGLRTYGHVVTIIQ